MYSNGWHIVLIVFLSLFMLLEWITLWPVKGKKRINYAH